MFKVRVVIVTFNNQNDIVECLESLSNQAGVIKDVVVIDNASSDKTLELLRNEFPEVKIIENSVNRGFTSAVNQGLTRPLPEYVALLNPDTCSKQDWLYHASKVLESNPTLGACQATVLLHDRRNTINSNGNVANFLMFGWPGGFEQVYDGKKTVRSVIYPSGCAVVFRRDCLEKVEGLDELMFMYHDDLDIGLRAFLLGCDSACSGEAIVFHKYAYRESPRKFYFLERNRIISLLKLYGVATLAMMFPILLVTEIAIWMKALREGWLSEKVLGYGSILKHTRVIWKARAAIQTRRERSDSQLIEHLRGSLVFRPVEHEMLAKTGNKLLDKYRQFLLGLRLSR
jgi:GT2 family glycosyltransferase